jgi:hypothetical protein
MAASSRSVVKFRRDYDFPKGREETLIQGYPLESYGNTVSDNTARLTDGIKSAYANPNSEMGDIQDFWFKDRQTSTHHFVYPVINPVVDTENFMGTLFQPIGLAKKMVFAGGLSVEDGSVHTLRDANPETIGSKAFLSSIRGPVWFWGQLLSVPFPGRGSLLLHVRMSRAIIMTFITPPFFIMMATPCWHIISITWPTALSRSPFSQFSGFRDGFRWTWGEFPEALSGVMARRCLLRRFLIRW